MAIVFSNTSNRSFGDRFIPNRFNFNVEMAHFKLSSSDNHNKKSNNDIFNLKPKHLNKYRELLQSTLNYHYSPIYTFKNSPNTPKKIERKSQTKTFSQWPCMPRKYPVLSKPDIILDWPNGHSNIYWNIVDWGSNGYLATIWSNKVFLWRNKDSHQEEVLDTEIQGFGALKWNHAGTQLAVAGMAGKLTVWTFPENKVVFSGLCNWHSVNSVTARCSISSIAWDRTDALLVSGCCMGFLMVWDTCGKVLGSVRGHRDHRIITMVFCASNKYLCTSGTDGMVRIWIWPKLEPHVEINYCSPVRAIAFHPWRPALLAVGGGLGDGSLSLWNVNTCQQVAQLMPERESLVDCLAWSPATGELVSSHLLLKETTEDSDDTRVLVLAALDRVVDRLDDNQGRVLYLLWDKTGERLGEDKDDIRGSNDDCVQRRMSLHMEFFGKYDKELWDKKQKYTTNREKCAV